MKTIVTTLLFLISLSLFSQRQWVTESKTITNGSNPRVTLADTSTFSFSTDFKYFVFNEIVFTIDMPISENKLINFHNTDKTYFFSLDIINATLWMAFTLGNETYVVTYKIKGVL